MKKFDSILAVATWLNLLAVMVISALIMGIGEHWWFSAALVYLPRLPWLLPSVVLVPVLLWRRWKWTPLAIVPIFVVAVPLMGLCMPVAKAAKGEHAMRIASCNIQDGLPRFASVAHELERYQPDIIVLQECTTPRPRLAEMWPDFHHFHMDDFDVTSRWPIEMLEMIDSRASNRYVAVVLRVSHPERPFLLVDVHLSTPRHGLSHLRDTSNLGSAVRAVTDWQLIRQTEIEEMAARIRELTDEPVVMAGDFNQPWSSQFVQNAFGHWTNAFDVAGSGYGYTTPTDTKKIWPSNTPWARVDHVVVNASFGVTHAEVGRSSGSDHRMIVADLTW